jgi:hypothetical protein
MVAWFFNMVASRYYPGRIWLDEVISKMLQPMLLFREAPRISDKTPKNSGKRIFGRFCSQALASPYFCVLI